MSSSSQRTKTRENTSSSRLFVKRPSHFFHVWLPVLQWAIWFCICSCILGPSKPWTCMSGHNQQSKNSNLQSCLEVKHLNRQTVTTHRRSPRVHCSPLNSPICVTKELATTKTVDDSFKCKISAQTLQMQHHLNLSWILWCSFEFGHHYSNSVIWLKHVFSTFWLCNNFTISLTKTQLSGHIEQLILRTSFTKKWNVQLACLGTGTKTLFSQHYLWHENVQSNTP